MSQLDIAVIVLLIGCLAAAVISFASIEKYLIDRNLMSRDRAAPDLRKIYRAYIESTRHSEGRVGTGLWVHGVFAGLFILTGVIYSIIRLTPLLLEMM